jgi:NAD dependent epimerase/dehydratase family enzyme
VTNAEFTDVLSEVVDRRAYYTVPAFILKLIYGQMAEETILSSQRVKPVKLPESGYKYRIPDLREALRASVKD